MRLTETEKRHGGGERIFNKSSRAESLFYKKKKRKIEEEKIGVVEEKWEKFNLGFSLFARGYNHAHNFPT